MVSLARWSCRNLDDPRTPRRGSASIQDSFERFFAADESAKITDWKYPWIVIVT